MRPVRPLLALAVLSAGCQLDGADGPGATEPAVEAPSGREAPDGAYAGFVARYGEDYEACGRSDRALPGGCGDATTASADPAGLRVELILDASGSMAGRLGGGTKMDAARDALTAFAESVPDAAQVALRVYGHVGSNRSADKAASCAGTELRRSFGPMDAAAFAAAIDGFEPTGWTPIAASLDAAAADLAAAGGSERAVYLVSDGVETCDGDPVEAARRLHTTGVRAIVNVIGFDVDDDAARQLRAVAEAGGGRYLQAETRDELWAAFNETYASAWERYTCVHDEQWEAYDRTHDAQWARYNCLHDRAWREYNAIHDEAWRLYNAGELDAATRASVVDQARAKRQGIVEPARAERNRVVEDARRQRTETVDEARGERTDRTDDAREARDAERTP